MKSNTEEDHFTRTDKVYRENRKADITVMHGFLAKMIWNTSRCLDESLEKENSIFRS